jgi:hypothetical protein
MLAREAMCTRIELRVKILIERNNFQQSINMGYMRMVYRRKFRREKRHVPRAYSRMIYLRVAVAGTLFCAGEVLPAVKAGS